MKIIQIEQGSDQWHEERFRCVTGTRIQQAIGAKFSKAKGWTLGDKAVQQTLMMEMVSEFQSHLEIDDFQNDAMIRGHELEPLSVAAASERLNVKFEACGMLQSDSMPNFKYSPDAVCYGPDGKIVGGYETKSKAGKKHIEYQIDNKVPEEHLWQCLAPMIMDDCVKWWAFGHYDDRNHVNPLFLAGVKRADYEEQISEARVLLEQFFVDLKALVESLGGEYND